MYHRYMLLYTEPEYSFGSLEVRRVKAGADAHFPPPIPAIRAAHADASIPEPKRFQQVLVPPEFHAVLALENEHGPPCDPALVDDNSPSIRYGGEWRRTNGFGDACGGGTLTFSETAGSEAVFDFTGTSVAWVFSKAINEGRAEVFIDGASRGVVDQYSPCSTARAGCLGIVWHAVVAWDGLQPGRHSITVRVLHEKSEKSQGYGIAVDGFVVR
jgi:hypothetical protein